MIARLVFAFLLALPALATAQGKTEKAIFAAGCFWCTEAAFDEVPGVLKTTSGYVGGKTRNPTYEQVSSGTTGHAEALEVTYDPAKVSYEKLLDVFWLNHDPTVTNRQFCDGGTQYRPGIFYLNETQHRLAEASKAKWEKQKPFKQPILTEITPAGEFWPAEEYHQDFHVKNPVRYKFYVTGCGRYDRLDQLWGALRKPH